MNPSTLPLRLLASVALACLASCTLVQEETTPPQPVEAPAPLSAPAQTPAPPPARAPSRYHIDAAASTLVIRVTTSGRLAREGINHVVEPGRMSGEIVKRTPLSGSTFQLEFPVRELQVDRPQTRKRLGEKAVEPGQAERVRLAMLSERVLDAGRFPAIHVDGRVVAGKAPQPKVDLKIRLHGVEKNFRGIPVTVKKTAGRLQISGRMKLRQTDFGITPLRLLAGSLKVDDELDIEFRFVARTPAAGSTD